MSALAALGLPADASAQAVKHRFRELALEQHPDQGGDPLLFQLLRQNYTAALQEVENRPCPTCQGTGKIRHQNGFYAIEVPCPQCGGVK